MNVVGYKASYPCRRSAFTNEFYMNVVGYKADLSVTKKGFLRLFYMNVVGYKGHMHRQCQARHIVLYERSGI